MDNPSINPTGRSCGSCSLCCKLLNVPAAGKPDHEWCPHCRPGRGGCAIYNNRPDVCRKYACQWLLYSTISDVWFPAKAKIVVDYHRDEETGDFMYFHVDPVCPDRWREQPYLPYIKRMSLLGLQGTPDGAHWQTVVVVRDKRLLILPDCEVPHALGITLRTGENQWRFIPCKSNDDVRRLSQFLTDWRQDPDCVSEDQLRQLIAECMPE